MLNTVCVYQTQNEVGYATRPLREKIHKTTNAIRILFCELSDEDLDGIDELYAINAERCAIMIMDSLDANPNTRYMN